MNSLSYVPVSHVALPVSCVACVTCCSGHYTSTWVDEMSEYLQSNQLELEEEEDSDLDGFVASDEEFLDDAEEVNDYSSEIRKIFGYDRRKYVCGYILYVATIFNANTTKLLSAKYQCILCVLPLLLGLMMMLLMTL